MNQILYVEEKKSKSPTDIKKIIMIFSIAIIVFGIIILSNGAYAMINKKGSGASQTGQKEESAADIKIEQDAQNNVSIRVSSEYGISELIYNWNSGAAKTIDGQGKTAMIIQLDDVPTGENTLNVTVITIDGNESKQSKTVVIQLSKPKINATLIGEQVDGQLVGNQIKIIVNSEADLVTVTYKWNSEEEKVIDMSTYVDKKNLEEIIEVPIGQNTLKITATDSKGQTSEDSKEVKGVPVPQIKIYTQNGYMHFQVTSEDTISSIEFIYNNQTYKMDSSVIKERKEVKYKLPLVSGMNYIKITAKTVNNAKAEKAGKKEYTPS